MKRTSLGPIVFASVVVLILLVTQALSRGNPAAAQGSPSTWRYAYVVASQRGAEVCYAEPAGCRIEEVSVDPVYVRLRGAGDVIDTSATSRRAIAKAVHALGEAGWEMVGSGLAYGHHGDSQAVHFRRGR